MTAVVVKDVFPAIVSDAKAQWLMRRRELITASDVPAILGFDDSRKPSDVWLEKLGQADEEETWPMIYGTAFQDGVGRAYARHTGRKVRMASLDVPEVTVHPDIPWLGATPDGETDGCEQTPAPPGVDGPGTLEIKISSVAYKWDENELPTKFQLQALTQIACAGAAWGSIGAFVSLRQPPRRQDVVFDRELFDLMVPKLEEFRQRVIRKEPPLAEEPGWWSTDAIRRVWSVNNGLEVNLDEIAAGVVKEWCEAKALEAKAGDVVESLGNQLRLRLAGAAVGHLPGGARLVLSNVKEGWVAAFKRSAHTRLLFKELKGRK